MLDFVKVTENFEELGKFICNNMLNVVPKERKTIPELIEKLSELFFYEVTKFSITTPVVETVEVVAAEVKEEVTETVEVVAEKKTEVVVETAINVQEGEEVE